MLSKLTEAEAREVERVLSGGDPEWVDPPGVYDFPKRTTAEQHMLDSVLSRLARK